MPHAPPPPPEADQIPCLRQPGELPRAGGAPPVRAALRSRPEDFRVEEVLRRLPEGEGPHVWLRIRKRNVNTEEAARRIAGLAGVPVGRVGFAGLKDRRAIATQWFSVGVAGRPEPRWEDLAREGIELLEVTRHRRKLRHGAVAVNRFDIVLREIRGEWGELENRLELLAARGVPNYFGEQRFGRDGGNVRRAYAMFSGAQRVRDRHRRGLYISAARSLLFNRVAARRVAGATWDRALSGEVMMLDGTRSIFPAPAPDAEIRRRVQALDIHPTGPLWGRGESPVRGAALALEREALEPCGFWRAALEAVGLEHERRALRVRVRELRWAAEAQDALRVQFALPPGSYATAVLRELAEP